MDYMADARSYRSKAAACTRRGVRDAREAAQAYEVAARELARAAWLTQRSELWRQSQFAMTPALYERSAALWTAIADRALQASFRADTDAAFYRDLGRHYAELAARKAARLAALGVS
jgi:hypothetical protein